MKARHSFNLFAVIFNILYMLWGTVPAYAVTVSCNGLNINVSHSYGLVLTSSNSFNYKSQDYYHLGEFDGSRCTFRFRAGCTLNESGDLTLTVPKACGYVNYLPCSAASCGATCSVSPKYTCGAKFEGISRKIGPSACA